MQSLFHLAASVDALLAAATTAWAMLGEVITAGALLLALDRLAAAIRFTYKAGVFAGRILWPVVHAAVAGLRWLERNIDWAEVFATVLAGLKVVIAGLIAAAINGHQLLIRASATLGRVYASLVVREAAATPAIPPALHPLAAIAAELETMPAKQLRSALRIRRRYGKAQLVEMALAW